MDGLIIENPIIVVLDIIVIIVATSELTVKRNPSILRDN